MSATRPAARPAARRVERGSGRTDRRGAAVDRAHGQLAAHLTDRDRWCVRMLAEHRVLTTTDLIRLAFTDPRRARRRLGILRELGVLDSFQPLHGTRHGGGSAPLHWVAPPLAYAMLAAEDGHDLAPQADSRQVGRGVALAHNAQLGHQLAVNSLLVDLATSHHATSHHTTGRLVCWWGQARCTQHLAPARPDAYAVWATPPTDSGAGGSRVGFAVEWDTGSEPLTRLAAKLRGYHRLAIASAIVTPVLVWMPGPRREHNAQAVLAAALADLDHPHLVPIYTTYPDPALTSGHGTRRGVMWHPGAPILRPLPAGRSRVGETGSARVSLDDLARTQPERGLTHAALHEPGPSAPGDDPLSTDLPPDHGDEFSADFGADFTTGAGAEDMVSGAGPGQFNATAWRTARARMWRSPHPTPPPAR